MTTLTEKIISEIHRVMYRNLYTEISKPWRAYAEQMEREQRLTTNFDSSFNVGVLEQSQQWGVRTAGFAITKQLPQKSVSNLIKWQEDVKWAMRGHNLKFVKGIDEAQRVGMLKTLQEAVDKHQTPTQIARAFLSSGLQSSAVRAERIAVTEGTRAAAMGVMLAANDFPYEMEKRWVSSGDNRVRRGRFNHNIPVDEARDITDGWFNGENIMFPGDPRCSPGNTVNCRCMLALTAKRDVDGNLIPKRVRTTNRQLLTGVMVGATAAIIAALVADIFSDE